MEKPRAQPACILAAQTPLKTQALRFSSSFTPALPLAQGISPVLPLCPRASREPSPGGGQGRRELGSCPATAKPLFSKLGQIQMLCSQLKVTTVSPARTGQAEIYLH